VQGHIEAAVGHYNQVIETRGSSHRDLALAYFCRSLAREKRNRLDRARSDALMALSLEPQVRTYQDHVTRLQKMAVVLDRRRLASSGVKEPLPPRVPGLRDRTPTGPSRPSVTAPRTPTADKGLPGPRRPRGPEAPAGPGLWGPDPVQDRAGGASSARDSKPGTAHGPGPAADELTPESVLRAWLSLSETTAVLPADDTSALLTRMLLDPAGSGHAGVKLGDDYLLEAGDHLARLRLRAVRHASAAKALSRPKARQVVMEEVQLLEDMLKALEASLRHLDDRQSVNRRLNDALEQEASVSRSLENLAE
jgi:hypothetical protein